MPHLRDLIDTRLHANTLQKNSTVIERGNLRKNSQRTGCGDLRCSAMPVSSTRMDRTKGTQSSRTREDSGSHLGDVNSVVVNCHAGSKFLQFLSLGGQSSNMRIDVFSKKASSFRGHQSSRGYAAPQHHVRAVPTQSHSDDMRGEEGCTLITKMVMLAKSRNLGSGRCSDTAPQTSYIMAEH